MYVLNAGSMRRIRGAFVGVQADRFINSVVLLLRLRSGAPPHTERNEAADVYQRENSDISSLRLGHIVSLPWPIAHFTTGRASAFNVEVQN